MVNPKEKPSPTRQPPDRACPSCGARLGGREGCQSAFDQLSAQAWASPIRAAAHNLGVDTYAMQHPEEYGRSPKSYAAHLTALYCGIEHAGDQKLYWAIARWLDGSATVEKPPLVARRGSLTIADVYASATDEEYADLVRRWARNVWAAYSDQQKLARSWLEAVRARTTSGGSQRKP
jgi:uncharacterized protein DUF5946